MNEDFEAAMRFPLSASRERFALAVWQSGERPVYIDDAGDATAFVSIHYDMKTRLAVVLMVDLGNGASITNSAGELLAFIHKNHTGRRAIPWDEVKWAYRDSMGNWDEIVLDLEPDPGAASVSVSFKPLGGRTIHDAIGLLVARGFPLDGVDVANLKAWAREMEKKAK